MSDVCALCVYCVCVREYRTVCVCVHNIYIIYAHIQPEEVYLNLVMEFVPETIYRIIKHYSRTKRQVPGLYVKVIRFSRALLASY